MPALTLRSQYVTGYQQNSILQSLFFCARCISEGRDEVYEETQLEAEIAQLKKRISTLKNTEDFDEASEQHMRVIHDDVTLHRH